jgi:hypothetical protein
MISEPCNFHAKEKVELTQSATVKGGAQLIKKPMDMLEVRPSDNDIIHINKNIDCAGRGTMNEERCIRLTMGKSLSKEKCTETLEPSSRSLLKAIKSLMELTYILRT